MIEVILLLAVAFAWLIFAVISDYRTTEIPNWLNFSLIIFALGIRFFHSLFSGNFNFLLHGVIGFGIFFAIGNLMYYGKIFGGGDMRLMIALGTIIPLSNDLLSNIKISVSFLFLFLIFGSVYGIFASTYFAFKNARKFRKEFVIQFRENLRFSIMIMLFGIITLILGITFDRFFLYFGILIFILPVLYVFLKSIDNATMRKKISPEFLREGDWLYEDVRVGKRLVRANWEGLTKSEIMLLKKRNKPVMIKQGIAFGIVFLASFLTLVYFYFFNLPLWNSFW